MLALFLGGALLLVPSAPAASTRPQSGAAPVEDVLYWDVPLEQISWSGAQENELAERRSTLLRTAGQTYSSTRVVLDGTGEAFAIAVRMNTEVDRESLPVPHLVASVPREEIRGDTVSGSIFFNEYFNSPLRLDFVLPVELASKDAQQGFERGRFEHNQKLLARRVPGSAWFRHNAGAESPDAEVVELAPFGRRRSDLGETFDLFSGGRAVAENLQLDRLFPNRVATADEEQPKPDVALETIRGIDIKAYDWGPQLKDTGDVELDMLLSWIPEDQHVLLTPSFRAFVQLLDELDLRASPVVTMLEANSNSASSRMHLEEQLALSLDNLARVLGPALIKSVAVTGGDLYMRTGTDVALLFECRQVQPVVAHLRSRYEAAVAADPTIERIDSNGVEGIRSRFGRVSSFFQQENDVVMVSNSMASLERLENARGGHSLADLDEARYFRSRYPLAGGSAETNAESQANFDESAFVLLSDATIRRWCGPRWRIAASRRLRALAALLEIQASHLDELVAGLKDPVVLEIEDPRFGDLGQVTLTNRGVCSSIWGSTLNLKPIVEMNFDTVSAQEAALYGRWRDGYARNWSGSFDPIAASISIDEEALGLDLTILPLIDSSDYREMLSWTRDARLQPDDGDPHANTLFHFAMAIDPDSPEVLELQGLLSGFAPGEVSNVLGWMSGSLSLYADQDEIWDVVLEAEDLDEAMEDLFVELNDLPLVVSVGSNSPLKLAAWMTALRGFAEGSAPGLTQWITLKDEDENSYVKVSGDQLFDNDEHLLYATLPEALVVSLNEATLVRAIKRFKSRRGQDDDSAQQTSPARDPWLGESAVLRISRQGIAILGSILGDSLGREAQRATFANLPILNEWKRLFPDRDPVEMHRRIFGQELRCAAGGKYVWDEQWKTMASTVFGHPDAPKPLTQLPAAIGDLKSIDAGLTFEQDGLRARLQVLR